MITQIDIADILVMEEKIKMLREEIVRKKDLIADALRRGAKVEYGGHAALLEGGKVQIHPFRGAIMRSGSL